MGDSAKALRATRLPAPEADAFGKRPLARIASVKPKHTPKPPPPPRYFKAQNPEWYPVVGYVLAGHLVHKQLQDGDRAREWLITAADLLAEVEAGNLSEVANPNQF
jgi:hypothetical protein